MARKPKSVEPSLRDKLSARFLEAIHADFEEHGVDVIQKLRDKDPKAYCEISARLIAATEPPGDGFENAQSLQEIGVKLLESVGCPRDAITEDMAEAAVAAQDDFTAALSKIGQGN